MKPRVGHTPVTGVPQEKEAVGMDQKRYGPRLQYQKIKNKIARDQTFRSGLVSSEYLGLIWMESTTRIGYILGPSSP